MKRLFHYISLALAVLLVPVTGQAVTITWNDNINPLPSFPGVLANSFPGSSATTTPFPAGKEFRIIALDSVTVANNHKDVVFGGEQWVFDDLSGQMTAVTGTGMTPGATTIAGSAAPGGDTGLLQNAPFATMPFGFLAPTLGSLAGDTYGVATLTTTGSGFDILFPVLEAQWGDVYFTLGTSSNGITFGCDVTGIDVICTAEHVIDSSEDPVSAGFNGFKPQWELHGTIESAVVPLPGAVWLFGTGLASLLVVTRRSADRGK